MRVICHCGRVMFVPAAFIRYPAGSEYVMFRVWVCRHPELRDRFPVPWFWSLRRLLCG